VPDLSVDVCAGRILHGRGAGRDAWPPTLPPSPSGRSSQRSRPAPPRRCPQPPDGTLAAPDLEERSDEEREDAAESLHRHGMDIPRHGGRWRAMDISLAVVERMGAAGTAPGEDGCRRYFSGKGWVPPYRRSDHRRTTRAALPPPCHRSLPRRAAGRRAHRHRPAHPRWTGSETSQKVEREKKNPNGFEGGEDRLYLF
jgi:hypothetical protein